ncbi:MAG: WhiB family transcriptional regulator [Acidimicrobiales bacterium]|jgi:WhiB family transcriptional regulator, redox-sensing transcriptional regulator
MNTEWMANGNCAELPPETFFPSDGVGVIEAQKICRTCVVQDVCLEYAVRNRVDHGIWGGYSERGRRKLIRARAQETAVHFEELAQPA